MGRSRGLVGPALPLLMPVLGLLAAGCVPFPAISQPDDGPPEQLTSDPPAARGTLIEAVQVQNPDQALASIGARVWRMSYVSRSGLDDRPIEVSGMVVVPAGDPPPGGWPVISYAHGTTGLADQCAPSRNRDLRGQLPVVAALVGAGNVVAASDYEGLGTPGEHPYLEPVSAARGVIDAVPAARQVVPEAGRRWQAVGISQGGQAAWAAAELADDGPDGLDFLGAVAVAPPPDVAVLLDRVPDRLTGTDKMLYGAVLHSLRLRHPELDLTDYLSGSALQTVRQGIGCLSGGLAAAPDEEFEPRSAAALVRAKRLLADFRLPLDAADVPLFIAAATADEVIPLASVDAAVERACGLGHTVSYRRYDVGHPALPAAEADAAQWITDRFAGRPAPNDCAR